MFQWSLSDNKSPQVSRTHLSILAVSNNAVVWMVSTLSPTSKSSMLFNNALVTVPKAPITIGIIVTFMFHDFFYYYYFTFYSWVFHTNIGFLSISVVWMTASFFRSPGFFWIFWLIPAMLQFGCFRFFLWIPISPMPSRNICELLKTHQIRNGFSITLMFHRCFSSLELSKYLSVLFFSFIFTLWLSGTANSTREQVLFVGN